VRNGRPHTPCQSTSLNQQALRPKSSQNQLVPYHGTTTTGIQVRQDRQTSSTEHGLHPGLNTARKRTHRRTKTNSSSKRNNSKKKGKKRSDSQNYRTQTRRSVRDRTPTPMLGLSDSIQSPSPEPYHFCYRTRTRVGPDKPWIDFVNDVNRMKLLEHENRRLRDQLDRLRRDRCEPFEKLINRFSKYLRKNHPRAYDDDKDENELHPAY